MADERATDLDVKRQIFRECQGATEALARAFAGADDAFPMLSRDAAALVERQLIDLARRTLRLIDAVAFASGLTNERTEHEVALQRIGSGGDGGGFAGDGGDSPGGVRSGVHGSGWSSDAVSRDAWDDVTPEVTRVDQLFTPDDLVSGAVSTAVAQIGQREDAPNSGLMIDQYLRSVDLEPGQSWCAAFVHWCFQMASNALGMLNPCPKTGGVLRLWELAPEEAKATSPVRGAIIVMDHGHGHGHTGIVESVNGGGLIETVEGNTNRAGSREGDSVARHIWRPEDGARGRLVGYIDLSLVPLVSRKPGAA